MSDATLILAGIRATLAEIIGDDPGIVSPDTDLVAEYDLDSILFVQFLLGLEQRFPTLEFNQDTLADDSFQRVSNLVELIEASFPVAAE